MIHDLRMRSSIRAVSDIPMSKPVAGVRVGLLNGQFIVNPTIAEMERSTLDLVVAGTADAVLMIEASIYICCFSHTLFA